MTLNASPSLSRAALDAALLGGREDATIAGPFACVSGCGEFDVSRFVTLQFVCPECRAALVPAAIAEDVAAVRRYVEDVFGTEL
jgi:hypothetical protein